MESSKVCLIFVDAKTPFGNSASLDCFTTSELLNELLIRAQSAEGSFGANVKSLNSGSLVSNSDLETNHRLPGRSHPNEPLQQPAQ